MTASGLKLALRATASPVQIHSGPPICLALDRGHLLKAIVGNCHMLGQKGPKIAAVVLCICLRVCSTVCGCAIVCVCLWHEFREAAAGLGPSQGLCSGAVRKQACCETPTLPWRSGRNALLQQGLDTGSTCCPSPRGTGRISGGGRHWWSPSAAARPQELFTLPLVVSYWLHASWDSICRWHGELLRCARIEKCSKTSRVRMTSMKLPFKSPIKSKLEVWGNVW